MSNNSEKTMGDLQEGNVRTLPELNIALNVIYQKTISLWLKYLRQIQVEYGVVPIIAGGALRDLIFNKPINNIDVFIARPYLIYPDWVDEICECEGWARENLTGPVDYIEDVVEIARWTHSETGYYYNFILLDSNKSAKDVISGFDFGINQIAVNTYGIAIINKPFITDMENRTFTPTNDESQEVVNRRASYLQDKFPLWRRGSSQVALPE